MCVSGGLLLLLLISSMSSAVRVLSRSELRCPRQDLNCTASQSGCMDPGGLTVNAYTPSGPEGLQVSVSSRQDEEGRLQPVLRAQWSIRDDGSIRYLKATELQVLVLATNQNLCVRYSFQDKLPMRSPSGEKWTFSADMLVLDPGFKYKVSVFNIPRPELDHTWYDVSRDVVVPDCDDPRMHLTQFCIQRGSLWRPNVTVEMVGVGGESVLAVSFLTDSRCETYRTIVSCLSVQHTAVVSKAGREALNSTFSLDRWPRSCCQFRVEIKPLFPQCGEDCRRVRKISDICGGKPVDSPDVRPYTFVVLGGVFTCVGVAAAVCFFCRKSGTAGEGPAEKKLPAPPPQPTQIPKVLVIYSQDHRLYRDVVLKLCAFLQAKCGTQVLVDLLDSTSVSVVGRLRWLERQQQQLTSPSDKILVLCSRGVQAKWRAMCGHGRVTLREDVLSPTDDMLTPFLNLFLPKMHHTGMLGKYMVAYFEDLGCERDVPSVFDIAVKYSLMKHFEELYFRLLDLEKYQPGQVNYIQGIGGDEYFNCPSGEALRLAIQTFRAHQLKHPDWFEKECVRSEEELLMDATLAVDQLPAPGVVECVPLLREGPPAYSQEVELSATGESVHVVAPELNPRTSSIAQLAPVLHGERGDERPATLLEVLTDPLGVRRFSREPVYVAEPVIKGPPFQERFCLSEEASGRLPTEEDEEEEEALLSGPVAPTWLSFQNPEESNATPTSCSSCFPPSDIIYSHPVETEENQDLDPAVKGSNSGSDQGYGSRPSSQPDGPPKEDPLAALARLQEALFEQSVRFSQRC